MPSIFPFSSNARGDLGRSWSLSGNTEPVFDGIDVNSFSPLTYNDEVWNISYVEDGLDERADVLLLQKDKPVLVRWSVGNGTVLWSGMNFAYHAASYNNMDESRFYVNLLASLVPLGEHEVILGEPNFVSDRVVEFQSNRGGRGVLFKEQFFFRMEGTGE